MSVRPPPAVGRLLKRPDFLAAARGRRFHTERMSVQGLRRADESPASGLRLGLTITKKVGHAPERNRIRRRLRAAAAEAALPFSGEGFDVVLIARRPAISVPFTVLIDDLARALRVVTKSTSTDRGPRASRDDSKPTSHA